MPTETNQLYVPPEWAFTFQKRGWASERVAPVKVADDRTSAPLDVTLNLLGQTWIPLLVVLLGVELAAIASFRGASEAVPLSVVKLLVPPALAVGLAALFGLDGMMRTVLVLQASMPTAVNGVVFARQFGTRPALVAATLVFSTVGSLVTLPILLSALR